MTSSLVLALVGLPMAVGVTGCATSQTAGEQLDDNTISRRVGARLTASPEVRRYQIDVDTVDRVVTLRGEVDSQEDKETAEYIARNTEGVRELRSLLTVQEDSREQERSRSQNQGLDDPQGQTGQTPAGTRYEGQGGAQYEGQGGAAADPESGDHSGMRHDEGKRQKQDKGKRPDAWVHTTLSAELAADPTVHGSNVDVDVDKGVVTLLGIVETEQAKKRAEELARRTEGVREVRNLLQVEEQQSGTPEQSPE